jgi:hemoglobin
MDEVAEGDICGLIGEVGFRRMVAAFYRKVPTDAVLGAMYAEDDLAGAEQRLGAFLIQRFGGPDAYSQARGHPRLRMRHAPFAIEAKARDHWLAAMNAAMDEAAFDPAMRKVLEAYFLSTANFMINVKER